MAGLSGSGGGGEAGAIQAGRAFVSMGVKDNTKTGLAQAEKQLRGFGQKAKSILGSLAPDTGVIGGLARGGLLGAGFSVAQPLVTRALEGLEESITRAKDRGEAFQRAMELSANAAKRVAEQAKEAVARLEEWKGFGAGADLMNMDAQVKVLDERIAELRKELFGLNKRIATDKKISDEEKAELEKGRGPLTGRINELVEQREKVKEQRDRFENPERDPAFLKRLQDLGDAIFDATDPAVAAMGELERKVSDLVKDRPLGKLAEHIELLKERAREADQYLKLNVGFLTRELWKAAQKRLEMDTKFFATRGVQGGPGVGSQLRFAESFQRIPALVETISDNTEGIRGEMKAAGNELKKIRMGAP